MKHLYIAIAVIFIGVAVTNAQTVAPVKSSGSKYSFKNKNLYFEVDTAKGARITSFKLNDKEILYTVGDMNGSTFWPSPQYPNPPYFGWPPIAEIDNKVYSVVKKNNKLIMKSQLSSKYKLRAYKVFSADDRDTSITIVYYIKNENTIAKSYAPWEISRVTAAGITLFAKGDTVVTGDMSKSAIDSLGCYWYNQNKKQALGNKFFCDGMGWLAHVNANNQVFVKKFENISLKSAAKGEAEIEVYTTSDHVYTELENQGAFVSIPAGDSIAWKVKWFARDLPADVAVTVGEQKVLDFVTGIVNLPDLRDTIINPDTIPSNIIIPSDEEAMLYPNPAENILYISGKEQNSLKSITIYNLQGAVVLKQNIKENQTTVNIDSLNTGSYVYEIITTSNNSKKGKLSVIK